MDNKPKLFRVIGGGCSNKLVAPIGAIVRLLHDDGTSSKFYATKDSDFTWSERGPLSREWFIIGSTSLEAIETEDKQPPPPKPKQYRVIGKHYLFPVGTLLQDVANLPPSIVGQVFCLWGSDVSFLKDLSSYPTGSWSNIGDSSILEEVYPTITTEHSRAGNEPTTYQPTVKSIKQFNLKPMSNSIITKLKQITRTEPEKSLVKVGILSEDLTLTPEGTGAFIAWLFDANKSAFCDEVAKPIIKAEQKQK